MKIICRICKKQQGQFYALDSELYLDDSDVRISAIDILRENFNLNVDLMDNLPQTLCLECFTSMKKFCEFILLAQESDKELRKVSYYSTHIDDDYINLTPDSTENETTAITQRSQNLFKDNITDENKILVKSKNVETIEIGTTTEESFYPEEQPDEDMWIHTGVEENEKFVDDDNVEKSSYELLNDIECISELSDDNRLLKHHNQQMLTTSRNRKYVQHSAKYTCEFCYKNFSTRSSLKSHVNTHSHEKPYQCTICGQTFQQSTILKDHMSLHIGKTIQCHICQKRFSRPGHLNIHLRQHNVNISNNNYDQCSASAATPPPAYKCDQCHESFIQQCHLEKHIMVHSNYNPGGVSEACAGITLNQIAEFEKSFNRKTLLTLHVKDEHKTRAMVLYCCNDCNVEFTTRHGLFRHIELKHPEASHV